MSYYLPHANPSAWAEIEKTLLSKIESLEELEATILRVYQGPIGDRKIPMPGLRAAIEALDADHPERFLRDVLPKIQTWALAIPRLMGHTCIPLQVAGASASWTLTREQVRSLLAMAFFSGCPSVEDQGHLTGFDGHYGDLSHLRLYLDKRPLSIERVRCLLSYFDYHAEGPMPPGDFTVQRAYLPHQAHPNWSKDQTPLSEVNIEISSSARMEDMPADAYVDFANRRLHIASVIPSCTQEEVLFSTRPALFLAMLISDEMADDEAIIMTGCPRYCDYTGYGTSFRFDRAIEPSGAHESVIAIDALAVTYEPAQQYTTPAILRDLGKAYIGFSALPRAPSSSADRRPVVSTGKWGCGVFGGAPQLKFLQQLMAAAVAKVDLRYSTFQDAALQAEHTALFESLCAKGTTVGQAFGALTR